MGVYNPEPDPIGLWLLKWIFGPLMAVGMIWCVVNHVIMTHKCHKIAEEHGYLEATYIAPNRAGFGEECICRRKRNQDGTVDEKGRLVIELDK